MWSGHQTETPRVQEYGKAVQATSEIDTYIALPLIRVGAYGPPEIVSAEGSLSAS